MSSWVVDPRVSSCDIAPQVGLSSVAVRARIHAWRARGFYLGREVWPSPALLGLKVISVDVPAASPVAAASILRDVEAVDDVIAGRVVLCERGRVVRVLLGVDDGAVSREQSRALRQLSPGNPHLEARRYWLPQPERDLTALEWKAIKCFRTFPEASLLENADRLRVTAKTLVRYRDHLVEQGLLWWIARLDPGRLPGVVLLARLEPPNGRSWVKSIIPTYLPRWIPCADEGFGLEPSPSMPWLAGVAMVDSPAAIEDAMSGVQSIEGVAAVRSEVPHRVRRFTGWLDRRLWKMGG